MQFCADVRAICRKQQTSNFERRRQGRGADSFVLWSYPIWVQSQKFCFTDWSLCTVAPSPQDGDVCTQAKPGAHLMGSCQTRSPSNLMDSWPNLTANGYCVQTSSLTNVEVRETNFTIIYHQASYWSCVKKFSLWNIFLTLFNSTIKGECCWVM